LPIGLLSGFGRTRHAKRELPVADAARFPISSPNSVRGACESFPMFRVFHPVVAIDHFDYLALSVSVPTSVRGGLSFVTAFCAPAEPANATNPTIVRLMVPFSFLMACDCAPRTMLCW
jgi:hypothetical protein